MTDRARASALRRIRANIARHGHHVYLVSGGPDPRFAYTIGLHPRAGSELILAGAAVFSADDVKTIVNEVAARLQSRGTGRQSPVRIDSLGSFSLREVHHSWADEMMLGALDFYGVQHIAALQIVPGRAHWTLDIPNLAQPWSAAAEPVWRWLREPWKYPVPEQSVAATNLEALRGERITEAARWEEDQWELFAGPGPEVDPDDMRVVPLGTLLGADESLEAVVGLPVGGALRREPDELAWQDWKRRT